jgi:hypothetical protein
VASLTPVSLSLNNLPSRQFTIQCDSKLVSGLPFTGQGNPNNNLESSYISKAVRKKNALLKNPGIFVLLLLLHETHKTRFLQSAVKILVRNQIYKEN